MQSLNDTDAGSRPIRVGLVNNMPDAALAATERQFAALLRSAWTGGETEIVLLDMPQIEREPAMRERMQRSYRPVHELSQANLDALIVTGARPGVGPLNQQGFWPGFTRLIDETLTLQLPVFWSCLAAQAAVAHLDGIQRRPLPRKYSGLFLCDPASGHPLLKGIDRPWLIPHSRMNDLAEADLVAGGYEILTRSDAVGADIFVKAGPPLFLFSQGHPEYEAGTLISEYRRDQRAFAAGTADTPPDPPVGIVEGAPPVAEWAGFAAGLIGNWLRAARGPEKADA